MVAEWQQIPLEDGMEALIDYRGKTPTKTQAGVPLITAKVVKNGRIETPNEFISHDDYDAWMRRGIPQAGDVLITTEAPLGEVAQLGSEKVALAQRLIALRGKNDVLDNTFLKFLLQSDSIQNQLRARASGSTVSGIKQSELRKINLLLPPLPEQRAIAHILGTLDNKIELNRSRNQTLEAMARALFKDWFVDFGPVRAKVEGREPYLLADLWQLFPDRLDDEGKPEGWEIQPLNTVASLVTASVSPGKLPETVFEHYSIPAFDSGRMPAREMGESIKSNKYIVDPDAVLVSKLNPQTPRVWLPAVATERAICSTEFMQFVPHDRVSRPFLYCLMSSQMMQEEVLKHVTGSTGSRQRAQPSQIAKVDTLMPQATVLAEFNRQAAPILKAVTENQLESQTLAQLRETLLPKLISGELRIKDADKFLERAKHQASHLTRSVP